MLFDFATHHKYIGLATLALFGSSLATAASFGKVVPTGGPASDIALDEPRGVLYIANYTSGRIDVMSLSDYTVGRSMTVAAYPGSVALSPDGRYLVITHYASSGGSTLARPGTDALTVIDLNSNQKRTFGLSSGPVGVAFGIDGLALILTQEELLLFDPVSGATTVLDTVQNVASQTLPVEQNTFPSQILAGALTATADGRHIFGVGGTTPDGGDGSKMVRFSYNVMTHQITANQMFTTAPSLGPRVISASRDGSYYMTGWALFGCGNGFLGDCTAAGPLLAQWPNASGTLNIGSVAIRSSKKLIYAQMTQVPPKATSGSDTVCLPNGTCVTITTPGAKPAAQSTVPPNLLILDADNLTVRERIQLPENLAGRSVFSADESVLYSISDSGVMVLPMAALDKAPRVMASAEDVVFRGNFCNSGTITQQLDVVDPAGNATPFQICLAGSNSCSTAGISISPSSGVTPARVKISIDPTMIGSMIGTKAYQFEIRSAGAVNMPPPPTRGTVESTYVVNTRNRFRVLVNNREPSNRGAFFNVPGELVDILADPVRNRFYVLRQDKNQVQVYDSTNYSLIATLRTGNTPTSMAITFDRNYLLVGNDNSQIANRYDLDSLAVMPPIVFQLGHYPRSIAVSGRAVLAASRVAGPTHTIDLVDLVSSTARSLSSLGPYKNDIHISTTLTSSPSGGTILAAMPDGRLLLYNANVDAFTISRQDFSDLKGALAASGFGTYVVDHYLLNESLVPLTPVMASSDASSGFAFVDQDGLSTAVTSTGSGYIQRLQMATGLWPLPTMMVEPPTVGDTDFPFRRTLAPLADRTAIVAVTISGFTVLPWNYDAATAQPVLDRLVSAGDYTKPVAPGGLVTIFGSQLSPTTMASADIPLPTVLGDSCLTVNGVVVPMQFASPTQINAQLPFQVSGNADVVLRTPGGVSDALHITIFPAAPSVFRTGSAGPVTGLPLITRASNGDLVTPSNPVHPSDRLTIYLTGMGQTSPEVPTGAPAPSDPLSSALLPATVSLGGTQLFVEYAGLTPGGVGVYQINATVPFKGVPTGFDIPLVISQGGQSTTVLVRVVN
jgi:uncharacterized protein (TIGR03437 family)